MDKLCPLAVFLLFFIPSAFFYRFCKKSVLPRWRYALVLLPGSQGAVLAVILSVIQSFPQEGSGARWLFSLLLPVQMLADVLLLRLLGRLEDGYQNRSRKAELSISWLCWTPTMPAFWSGSRRSAGCGTISTTICRPLRVCWSGAMWRLPERIWTAWTLCWRQPGSRRNTLPGR